MILQTVGRPKDMVEEKSARPTHAEGIGIYNGEQKRKRMKRRRRKGTGVMEEIKRRRVNLAETLKTCWRCVCDNRDHTMYGRMARNI
jgi:hypothetical protein